MAEKDYYKTLGLGRGASEAQIKKAYRHLARKHHPDVNPGDKASEERFKGIQEAYQVLGDAEKKKVYDQFGYYNENIKGQGEQGFPGFQGFDFGVGGRQGNFRDIFSDLFGGRRSRPNSSRPRRGADLEAPISIAFLDALKGAERRINVNRQVPCGRCKGSGSLSGKSAKSCPACGGSGQAEQSRGTMRFRTVCSDCGGSGQVRRGDCPECSGQGSNRKVDSLLVRIPAGVETGSRVRVARKGNAGRDGGSPGDLFLVIKVEPHPFFKRNGNDIICEVPLTVTEAALGAKIEVPTIDGKTVLKIPPGTQSGRKLRMRGRGVTPMRGGQRGDQLVEMKIVMQPIRDERSKEILRELERLNPQDPREGLLGSGD